jgi:hypothetical protein
MDESQKPETPSRRRWVAVFTVVFTGALLLFGAYSARCGSAVAESIHLKSPRWVEIGHSFGAAVFAVWWLLSLVTIVISVLVMKGYFDRRFRSLEYACAFLLVVGFALAVTGFHPAWTISRAGI